MVYDIKMQTRNGQCKTVFHTANNWKACMNQSLNAQIKMVLLWLDLIYRITVNIIQQLSAST